MNYSYVTFIIKGLKWIICQSNLYQTNAPVNDNYEWWTKYKTQLSEATGEQIKAGRNRRGYYLSRKRTTLEKTTVTWLFTSGQTSVRTGQKIRTQAESGFWLSGDIRGQSLGWLQQLEIEGGNSRKEKVIEKKSLQISVCSPLKPLADPELHICMNDTSRSPAENHIQRVKQISATSQC